MLAVEHRAALRSRLGKPLVLLTTVLVLSGTAACGDTNNVTQHADGDAKACLDNSTCVESEDRPTEPGKPGTRSPETSGPPDGSSGQTGSTDEPPPPTDPTRDDPAQAAPAGPSFLSDLKPVGGFGNDRRAGAAELPDGSYVDSVIFSPRYFGSDDLDLTYNVPAGAKRFQATVGPDIETEDGFKVLFQLSGAAGESFTLSPGQTREVDAKLNGAGRITLRIVVTGEPPDAVNASCRAVWGNARFA